ncbi:uncharacterized protein LOC102077903 isoform X3 [Oreochromis niloticus]|uniref:uncharacterized protein LOC102077903 isoform X3 n=1 Tax=Oreochromis niloticus TaxID=8128 RepID=UPI0009046A73|nr:uncharacterized protein LOC102077903 isoform X3 [Oreochromis niloticus]
MHVSEEKLLPASLLQTEDSLSLTSNSPAPLQTQVLKLRINMQTSLELNLTVQEDLLKMFRYRLKEKGVNGVTLKLSDGEVYQKEEHLTITQNMSCKPIC